MRQFKRIVITKNNPQQGNLIMKKMEFMSFAGAVTPLRDQRILGKKYTKKWIQWKKFKLPALITSMKIEYLGKI